MITLEQIVSNPNFTVMICRANAYLKTRGYTEHGFRHVNYVSKTTGLLLQGLDYDPETVELGKVAGYLHDVGNMHNRKHHGITGAALVFSELRSLGMPIEDVATITTAIANHEEEIGRPVSPVGAALILADKSDAHKTRVHRTHEGPPDIHDRVNLAILDSSLSVDNKRKTITFDIAFDQSMCQIMDFFEIYLTRMEMCKDAATLLGCRFQLVINGLELLGKVDYNKREAGA